MRRILKSSKNKRNLKGKRRLVERPEEKVEPRRKVQLQQSVEITLLQLLLFREPDKSVKGVRQESKLL